MALAQRASEGAASPSAPSARRSAAARLGGQLTAREWLAPRAAGGAAGADADAAAADDADAAAATAAADAAAFG